MTDADIAIERLTHLITNHNNIKSKAFLEDLTLVLMMAKDSQKLERFKEYVHRRLDEAGIPTDPDPENNTKTGCRIGSRLDLVLKDYKNGDL